MLYNFLATDLPPWWFNSWPSTWMLIRQNARLPAAWSYGSYERGSNRHPAIMSVKERANGMA
jgi:hypothetical protein